MTSFNHRDEHIDDGMIKVEVNLDDMTAEMLGYLMDELFEKGANDVYYTPIYMKKNRPAVMLSLLCEKAKLSSIKSYLFTETTTFGIRSYPISVHRLERHFRTVSSPWGEITVKQAFHNGELVEQSPEYEDCAKLARAHGVPLKTVYQQVWSKLN
ncbi:nickel insertion protein [Alteribacillus sp. JSM 102045]|uniref:nickel insertion protein n=1 Tax=Alteribacillus sp. JSM 102045 TaxID=1562101 RepID=UPI0035BF9B38